MVGLVFKDFINLRKNIKMFAAFIIIYGFMSYASQDTSFFSTVFTVLCAILTISLYTYDEMAKWDCYALTMPVSRDNIVQSKYIMMLLLTTIGIVLGVLFSVILYVTTKIGSPISQIKSCSVGAGVAIFFFSIAIPIITKMGVEKARFILVAIYIIPFVAVILIGKSIDDGSLVISQTLLDLADFIWKNIYLVLISLLLVITAISYQASLTIYRKKEF